MSMILTCSLKPSQHVLVPGICHCNTASLLHTFVRQLPRARKDDGEDALVLVCVYPETSPALFKTKQEKYVAQGKFKEKLSFTSSPSPPKLNCNAGILLLIFPMRIGECNSNNSHLKKWRNLLISPKFPWFSNEETLLSPDLANFSLCFPIKNDAFTRFSIFFPWFFCCLHHFP